jgi:hypothetical protein
MKPNGQRGVSMFVKATIVVSLVGAALLIWYLRRGHEEAPALAAPAPAITTGSAAPADAAKPRPNDRVRKVTPAERNEVARQIAEARKSRAATSAPAGPSLPGEAPSLPALTPGLDPHDIDSFKSTFKGAMKEVVPYLAECFDKHAADLPDTLDVKAKLSLHGDPDVGTLIDTDGLTDGKDGPLHAGFDLCVRDALASLALPPLAEGEEVQVNYPFVFTR